MLRALKFLIPLAVFAGIAWFLFQGLSKDPKEVPSPLIDKAAPGFSLPLLNNPQTEWTPQTMRGQVWLLNVWGSWCAGCQVEHPLLLAIAQQKQVPIVGLAWKDMPANAQAFLQKLGDPYSTVVMDFAGKVAIDYGVYGAPETFLIDKQGVIRLKHIGPLTPEALQTRIMPRVRQLQAL
jgi:cytochrome c biogenesis protein CcmG, thiol:disulfide interchange protein DsbE